MVMYQSDYYTHIFGLIGLILCLFLVYKALNTLGICPYITYAGAVKRRLENVIRANHLYNSHMEDGYERIDDSVTVYFIYDNDFLFIRFLAHGANYVNKIYDLGVVLSSALGLQVQDIDESNPTYVEYCMRRHQVERIYVSESNADSISDMDTIMLDTETEWNFTKAPHAIVAGATGGGKSTFLNYLILELTKRGADMYLIDPKRSDLSQLGDKFFSKGHTATTPNCIAKIMREVCELMNKRYEEHQDGFQKNYRDFNLRPVFVVFDEIAGFRAEADKKVAQEVDKYLKQIVMKGRQMGVFMILCTQKPTAETIPTDIRDQMACRVALGQMSNDGLRMVLGFNSSDLPRAKMGMGAGYCYVDGLGWTAPHAFRAPYLSSNDVDYVSALNRAIKSNSNFRFSE